MRKFRLTTKAGEMYYIHDNGNIERTDLVGFTCSSQWKLQGIADVRTGGLRVPFQGIGAWLAGKPDLLYKNGNPKFTVRDVDHGTTRTWGNTRFHGISSLTVV